MRVPYLPSEAFVISSHTTDASAWTYAFASEVNSENTDVRVGVLNDDGDVEPVNSATENRVFAQVPSNYTGAYLEIEGGSSSSSSSSAPSDGNCEYMIENEWGSGFIAYIVITNDGSSAINGWEVSWDYSGSTQVTNSWNAQVSGSGPYTASDMGWNGTIQPGESVQFGFQGSGTAEVPEVTGSVCN